MKVRLKIQRAGIPRYWTLLSWDPDPELAALYSPAAGWRAACTLRGLRLARLEPGEHIHLERADAPLTGAPPINTAWDAPEHLERLRAAWLTVFCKPFPAWMCGQIGAWDAASEAAR